MVAAPPVLFVEVGEVVFEDEADVVALTEGTRPWGTAALRGGREGLVVAGLVANGFFGGPVTRLVKRDVSGVVVWVVDMLKL